MFSCILRPPGELPLLLKERCDLIMNEDELVKDQQPSQTEADSEVLVGGHDANGADQLAKSIGQQPTHDRELSGDTHLGSAGASQSGTFGVENPSKLTQLESDVVAKSRGANPTTSAYGVGAYSVAATESVVASIPTKLPKSQQERDDLAKSRVTKNINLKPGAYSVGPMNGKQEMRRLSVSQLPVEPEAAVAVMNLESSQTDSLSIQPRVRSTVREPARAISLPQTASAAPTSMSQKDQDAQAKSRVAKSVSLMPGAYSVGPTNGKQHLSLLSESQELVEPDAAVPETNFDRYPSDSLTIQTRDRSAMREPVLATSFPSAQQPPAPSGSLSRQESDDLAKSRVTKSVSLTPGAYSVGPASGAQTLERLAEKQELAEPDAAVAVTNLGRAQSDIAPIQPRARANVREPARAISHIPASQTAARESDEIIKSRARQPARSVSAQPGAHAVGPLSDAPTAVSSSELSSAPENDESIKARARQPMRARSAQPGAQAIAPMVTDIHVGPSAEIQSEQEGNDEIIKSRARQRIRSTQPGAQPMPESVAADPGRNLAPTTTSTSRRVELPDLEALEAKLRATNQTGRATKPGAQSSSAPIPSEATRSRLNQMEEDVLAKNIAVSSTPTISRPGATVLRGDARSQLDERIAYKTGIPLDSPMRSNEEQPPRTIITANVDMTIAKLTGVSPETVRSASMTSVKLDAETVLSVLGHSSSIKNDSSRPMSGQYDLHSSNRDGRAISPIAMTPSEYFRVTGEPLGELAVAIAVEEDEGVGYIASAVEYDPNSKPPLFKNRRFRLYGCFGFLILLGLTIGLVFGLVVKGGRGTVFSNGI